MTLIHAIDRIGEPRFGRKWTGKEVVARCNLPRCPAAPADDDLHKAYEAERNAAARFLEASNTLQRHLEKRHITAYVEKTNGDALAITQTFWRRKAKSVIFYLGDDLERWANSHYRDDFLCDWPDDKIAGRAFVREDDLTTLLRNYPPKKRREARESDQQALAAWAAEQVEKRGRRLRKPEVMDHLSQTTDILRDAARKMYGKLPCRLRLGPGKKV